MVVRHTVIGQRVSREKKELADYLRGNMTEAENILWKELRANRLSGYHFRRQQIISGFIVDFYCHKTSLIVEVDGGIHDKTEFSDVERDTILERQGFRVLRLKNEEVKNDLNDVMKRIEVACFEGLSS
jgi:very-short-patch-repair endonuclease